MSLPTDSISSSLQRGDRSSMLQLLEELKKNRLPLPVSSRNWTALHLAASQPHYKEYLELLLKYSDSILMDINGLTYDGKTALHIACENCCEESVLILLQKGCDPYKATSDDHDSALHIAAGKGNSKIIEYLLNYPKNINEPNGWGETPLHFAAAEKGNSEVGRILLEKGANVRAITESSDDSPLHYACEYENLDMIQFLLECDSTLINCKNFYNMTPLMLAAKNSSDARSVRILYENGAQTDIRTFEFGDMALHFAVDGGKVEVFEYMLQCTETCCIEAWVSSTLNALNNVSNERGAFNSLLCRTIEKGNVECLEMLLSSNKLSPSILQAPNIERYHNDCEIYSPLAYLFRNEDYIEDEKFNSLLQLLLTYNIVMLDEFFKVYKLERWPNCEILFHSPFTFILDKRWPFSKIQQYFHLLNANDITIDYSLQCYHDNTESFATFTNYECYYKPVMHLMWDNDIEVLNLIMPNSAILEPDVMILQYHKSVYYFLYSQNGVFMSEDTGFLQKCRSLFEYLVSLKPTYYRQLESYDQLRHQLYPSNTICEEFSKSTLQQLCRTVIRQHLREPTLEGNLRHFHRKILELPLPPLLKDYLLFKYSKECSKTSPTP
ncbi:hypothetical protein V9T40_011140 [Parthenolecanium corni]|uniref:SOCS box domain-containing protein n=1 Tax=Parthenolecanium corni TaxID=536013 RepID=A0AAN9T6C2_9HEMI